MTTSDKKVELKSLFMDYQSEMMLSLSHGKKNIKHPVAKGDISEGSWLQLFQNYLPKRYRAEKAFVLDVDGNLSEQIDIVIFDSYYSPPLFKKKIVREELLYIPAESVYAIFEVKPTFNKSAIQYAAKKTISVRKLKRTSAPISYANGVYKPKKLHEILSGLLTFDAVWKDPFGEKFKSTMENLNFDCRLNFGCVISAGSFEIIFEKRSIKRIDVAENKNALIYFFLKLLSKLQGIGTVPALDYNKYIQKALK